MNSALVLGEGVKRTLRVGLSTQVSCIALRLHGLLQIYKDKIVADQVDDAVGILSHGSCRWLWASKPILYAPPPSHVGRSIILGRICWSTSCSGLKRSLDFQR